MVVVYLQNGEKAPMPDANYVRLDDGDGAATMLRCLFGEQEVGQFKWQDVAGYTISASREQPNSYGAWARHVDESI